MIEIRREDPADIVEIESVITQGFLASEFGHNGEADLVRMLRDQTAVLSLVACEEGVIVGHVLFSAAECYGEYEPESGMGLGPLSVLPSHQERGIGSRLVQHGLGVLRQTSCPFVVVLGDPCYYQRFGFAAAADFGLRHGFEGIPQSVFQVFVFDENRLRDCGGLVAYHSAFGPQS